MVSVTVEQVPRVRVGEGSRSFTCVRVVNDVSCDVLPSEIHGLVGENGPASQL